MDGRSRDRVLCAISNGLPSRGLTSRRKECGSTRNESPFQRPRDLSSLCPLRPPIVLASIAGVFLSFDRCPRDSLPHDVACVVCRLRRARQRSTCYGNGAVRSDTHQRLSDCIYAADFVAPFVWTWRAENHKGQGGGFVDCTGSSGAAWTLKTRPFGLPFAVRTRRTSTSTS